MDQRFGVLENRAGTAGAVLKDRVISQEDFYGVPSYSFASLEIVHREEALISTEPGRMELHVGGSRVAGLLNRREA